jgi:UPF0271 protein
VEYLGDGALRLELPAGLDPRDVLETLRALPRVLDVVVTERHACVYFDPAALPPDPAPVLSRLASSPPRPHPRTAVVIRARYDGPDLPRVADLTGLGIEEVIALHVSTEYTVRVVGFMPGFAYLGDLDPRLRVPRLSVPRPKVPAGAIGIAGARTGVYPFASPGGWNLIATAVDFVAFDAEHGAALSLGDPVRFERV